MKSWLNINILHLLLCLLIACNTSIEKPKQILPKKLITSPLTLKQNSFNNKITSLLNEFSKTHNIQEDSIPHRLFKNCGYNHFKAFSIKEKHKKNALHFQFYRFNEIAVCDTAQQKLLNNLGDNIKVEVGKNIKHIKSLPWYIIYNTDNIVVMHYNCENDLPKVTINNFKQQIHKQFATKNSKIINVECGGPLKWL